MHSFVVCCALILSAAAAPPQDEISGSALQGSQRRATNDTVGDDGWAALSVPEDASWTMDGDLSRDGGSISWRVRFQLTDEAPSEWRMTWLADDGGSARTRSGVALQMRFDPLYGAQWRARVASRRADGSLAVVERALPLVHEPEDLLFGLHVRLPSEGGVLVTFDDGTPLLVTRRGDGATGRLGFVRSGPVGGLSITPPRRDPCALSESSVRWLQRVPREPARLALATLYEARRQPTPLVMATTQPLELTGPSDAIEVREVGVVTGTAVAVEQLVLETYERVEIPALVVRPEPARGRRPGVVILPGNEPDGKLHEGTLDLARQLASRGATVLIPDPLGEGERREAQPHDSPRDLAPHLTGTTPDAWRAWECRRHLSFLAGRMDVNADQLAVVANGDAVRAALWVANADPRVRVLALNARNTWTSPGASVEAFEAWCRTHTSSPTAAWPPLSPALPATLHERRGWLADPSRWVDAPLSWVSGLDESRVDFLARTLELDAADPDAKLPPTVDLALGELEVGSMWESWFLGTTFARADEREAPSDEPIGDRLRTLLHLPVSAAAATVVATHPLEQGRAALWRLRSSRETWIDALVDGFPDGESTTALTSTPHVTLAIGDFGKLEALTAAKAQLPPRERELWIGVDLPGDERGGDVEAVDALLRAHGSSLLGSLVRDLTEVLMWLRATDGPDRAIRLVGDGAHGWVALATAAMDSTNLVEVVTLHGLTRFRELLEFDPRHRTPDSPCGFWSEDPHPAWVVPDGLGRITIEDAVLALDAAGVRFTERSPVDALRRPLSDRDLLARWPRRQHDGWTGAGR